MSLPESKISDKPPQPVPRGSRTTVDSGSCSQNFNFDIKTSTSEARVGTTVDNDEMNAEICRYRKGLQVYNDANAASTTCVSSNSDQGASDNNTPPSIADLRKRLQDVMEKNSQWQVYDNQREEYVKSLHVKYHDLYCKFQDLTTSYNQITTNSSSLSEQQRQYYDTLLIQAKAERESYQAEIQRLKSDIEDMKTKFAADLSSSKIETDHWKKLCENQVKLKEDNGIPKNRGTVTKANKENWDRISSLQREMELYRKEFSVERSRRESIERRLENMHRQLKPKDDNHRKTSVPNYRLNATESRSRKSRPSTSNHLNVPNKEKIAVRSDRRSHPADPTHITTRKKKSPRNPEPVVIEDDRLNNTYSEFSHHNNHEISCPNCGKVYAVDEHEFLLSHIDLCI